MRKFAYIKRFAGVVLLVSTCNWVHVLIKHFRMGNGGEHKVGIVYGLLMIVSSLIAVWVLFKDSNKTNGPTPPPV